MPAGTSLYLVPNTGMGPPAQPGPDRRCVKTHSQGHSLRDTGHQLSPGPSAEAPPPGPSCLPRGCAGRERLQESCRVLGTTAGRLWGGGGARGSTSDLGFMGKPGVWHHGFGSAHSVGKRELQGSGTPWGQGQTSWPVPLWLSPSPFLLQNTTHQCPAPCLAPAVPSVVPSAWGALSGMCLSPASSFLS